MSCSGMAAKILFIADRNIEKQPAKVESCCKLNRMHASENISHHDDNSAVSRQVCVIHDLTARARRIHQVLPQTQCRRCGYPDCAGYAQAVDAGEAAINQCPPGGKAGIVRIAQAMANAEEQQAASIQAQALSIDPAYGAEGPMTVAVIDEDWCIGCTLCIQACPTDAIVGSSKRMHTVQEEYCTGCDLCVLACPVDCIRMEKVSGSLTGWAAWSTQQAQQALQRYMARQLRMARTDQTRHARPEMGNRPSAQEPAADAAQTVAADAPEQKQAAIAAALARARALRAGQQQKANK